MARKGPLLTPCPHGLVLWTELACEEGKPWKSVYVGSRVLCVDRRPGHKTHRTKSGEKWGKRK